MIMSDGITLIIPLYQILEMDVALSSFFTTLIFKFFIAIVNYCCIPGQSYSLLTALHSKPKTNGTHEHQTVLLDSMLVRS